MSSRHRSASALRCFSLFHKVSFAKKRSGLNLPLNFHNEAVFSGVGSPEPVALLTVLLTKANGRDVPECWREGLERVLRRLGLNGAAVLSVFRRPSSSYTYGGGRRLVQRRVALHSWVSPQLAVQPEPPCRFPGESWKAVEDYPLTAFLSWGGWAGGRLPAEPLAKAGGRRQAAVIEIRFSDVQ